MVSLQAKLTHSAWVIGFMFFAIIVSVANVSAGVTGADYLRSVADGVSGYAIPGEEGQATLGTSSVACIPGTAYPDGSMIVGCTSYDLQKLGSMGRQIILGSGTGPDSYLEFVWITRLSAGVYSTSYESWSFDLGSLNSGGGGSNLGSFEADRYPVITPLHAGLSMVAENNAPIHLDYGRTRQYENVIPGVGFFLGQTIPDSTWESFDSGTPGTGDEFHWPQIAATISGSVKTLHMIIHNSDTTNTAGNNFLYTRHVGDTSDAFPNDNNWEVSRQVGWGGFHSAVIAASTNSNRVAIAFSGGRGGGAPANLGLGSACDNVDRTDGSPTGYIDNDLYVYISEDQGATWGNCANLTVRANADSGGYAPHGKVSLLFDGSDKLHVAWQSTSWPGIGGTVNKKARMYHWDEVSGLVRQAVDATWDAPFCSGTTNQLHADNPQLSFCDNKLFLTYTLFAPPYLGRADDCHTDAFGAGSVVGRANGDIYVSVSSTSGLTWDAPRNLTDTYTPDCDTFPGTPNPDCLSDTWQSTTRYGIDIPGGLFAQPISTMAPSADFTSKIDPGFSGTEYLHTIYVGDRDPGTPFFQPVDGGATDNTVNIFTFGCVEPTSTPQLSSSLQRKQAACDTVSTNTPVNLDWALENFGTAPMVYTVVTVEDPLGFSLVSGLDGSIPSGINNKDTGTITFDISQLSPGQTGSVDFIVQGNFPTSPDTFSFKYVYIPSNNTPVGSNVVAPASGTPATVTFDNVTVEGATSGTVSASGPTPPTSFTVIPSGTPEYYDLTTTATYTGNVQVCFVYTQPPPGFDESLLRLLHFVGTSWTDITTTLDTATNTICGVDTTLSPFIVGFNASCCNTPGDADNGGTVTIGDVTFLIARIFGGGPAPVCCEEGDPNGSGATTIGDVTYLIAHIFAGGPAPICGPAGMTCASE